MVVQLFSNHELNKTAWDNCIETSPHGLIYARSWYLDHLSPGWKGIVGEGYSWVMPLTEKSKYGFKYLYQPSFTQQLGVFASSSGINIPWQEIRQFLESRYLFWEINLHFETPPAFACNMISYNANNFIVNLKYNYKALSARYARVLNKNLKRSKQANLFYTSGDDPEEYIILYRKYYGHRISHVKTTEYDAFAKLCLQLKTGQTLFCRKVINPHNELMAVILMLCDGRRLYNIMNVTTEPGKRSQSNHYLIDSVINEFASTGLLLDLEGSDLPGVKNFYEGFGSFNQPYLQVKYNRLPWPLRLLK